MGRRKIEIKRIESKEARHVTFSKRRTGLFKKLGELCIHCGAEVAALVYSPGGKVHFFASPDEASVFARFMHMMEVPWAAEGLVPLQGDAQTASKVVRMQAECVRLQAECVVDAEKAGRCWWEEASLEELGVEELERLLASVVELREAVAKSAKKAGKAPVAEPPVLSSACMAPLLLLPPAAVRCNFFLIRNRQCLRLSFHHV